MHKSDYCTFKLQHRPLPVPSVFSVSSVIQTLLFML